jgi:hypothetical protein
VAESNLANNVITPWAYSTYQMFNPYAAQMPGAEKWGPQANGQAMPSTDGSLPWNTFNSWNAGASGGQGSGPSGLSNTAVMPNGPGGGGGAGGPSGGGSPFLTQDWFNAYKGLVFGGGAQAPQSPEEQMARGAAGARWMGANQDFNNAMGNSQGVGNGMLNASMGAFDQSGNFIGGPHSGLYSAAQQNLGQLGNGGAWGAYNDPKSWANSLQPYAQWGMNAVGGAGNAAMGSQEGWANAAPGAAEAALSGVSGAGRGNMAQLAGQAVGAANGAFGGIDGQYRANMPGAGNVAAGAMGNINPMLAGREAQTGAMWDQTSGGGFDLTGRRDAMGYDPRAIAQQGVSDTAAMNNKYEKSLMAAIDAETKATLAQQTPEVAAAMAAAGYGESGAGQGAMGSLVSSIMGQANRDKMRTLGDLTESNLARQAQAIGQRTNVGSQAASDVLNTASQTYNQASAQREQARNLGLQLGVGTAADAYLQQQGALNNMEGNIYGANANHIGGMMRDAFSNQAAMERDIFGANANAISGLQQQQWGARSNLNSDIFGANANMANNITSMSGNLLGQGLGAYMDRGNLAAQLGQQGLFNAEQAMQGRAGLNADINNSGFNMLSNLFNMSNQNYDSRMATMLGLGRSNQQYNQAGRNMMLDLLLMPYKTGMQITTGINTSPVPQNYQVSPWERMGANVAGNVLGGMVGGGGNNDMVNPLAY